MLTRFTLSALLVVGLWWHCSSPAVADATTLKPETPSVDKSKPVEKPAQSTPPVHEILYGGARKSHEVVDPNTVIAPESVLNAGATTNAPVTPLDAGATKGAPQAPFPLHAEDNIAALQSQDAKTDAYQLAVQKLSHGFKLTADEFRALGVGIVGYESDEGLFGKANRVTTVYRGSPAEAAGIHVGDKEVWTDEEKRATENGDPLFVNFDKAGTTKNCTFIRHGKQVTFTLTRMNIEDIPDPDIRREWEDLVQSVGMKGGNYTGTMDHLTPFK